MNRRKRQRSIFDYAVTADEADHPPRGHGPPRGGPRPRRGEDRAEQDRRAEEENSNDSTSTSSNAETTNYVSPISVGSQEQQPTNCISSPIPLPSRSFLSSSSRVSLVARRTNPYGGTFTVSTTSKHCLIQQPGLASTCASIC